jgi:hypothetical protein
MFSRLADKVTYFYLLRLLWRLAPDKSRLLVIYALSITANAIELTIPLIIAKIVTILARADQHTLHDVAPWLAAVVAIYLAVWALHGP